MLYAYNTATQVINQNENVNFNTEAIRTGCTATLSNGAISLNRGGYYAITFNADAAAVGADVQFQMYVNGVLYAGAEATESSTALTDIQHLGISTIVQVEPRCCNNSNLANTPTTVTIRSLNAAAATVTNATITVIRIRPDENNKGY